MGDFSDLNDFTESKQLFQNFKKSCDCDDSHKINTIANWVELRERYYHGALQMKDQNKLEKAHHYLHHAILCDPKHQPSYEEIVHILIEMKKFNYISYYLNKLKDFSPETASILRGHVYFAKKKFTNAEVQLQLSKNLNPTSQKAIFLLGLRNFLLERFDDSQVNFEKLITLNKNHSDAKFCLATISLFKGKYDQAIEEFNNILTKDPRYYLCYYHLALCYFMVSNYEASLRYCEETLKVHNLSRVYDLTTLNYFELKNKPGLEKINNKINDLYANSRISEEIYINNILIQSFDLMQTDRGNFEKVSENIARCRAIIRNSTNQELNEHIERLDYYNSVVNVLKAYQTNDEVNKDSFPLDSFKFHTNSLDTYRSSNFLYIIALNYIKKTETPNV